jgi:multiple sugar transport system permease protein
MAQLQHVDLRAGLEVRRASPTYAQLFADRIFWRAFWNTFFVVNGIVYAELLLGLGLALLLIGPVPGKGSSSRYARALRNHREQRHRHVAVHVRARRRTRVARPRPAGLGQLDWSTNPVETLLLASIIAIWHHLPFTFPHPLRRADDGAEGCLEASEIDGATRWQQFWLITLRLIMPAVLIAVLFRYIFAIRTFAEVWLLTEGGPARLSEVLAIYLYREMFKYHQFGWRRRPDSSCSRCRCSSRGLTCAGCTAR